MNRIEQELFDLEDYLRRNDDIADNSAYLTIIDIANKVSELDAENAKLRELADAVKEFVEDTHCEDCPCRRDCDDNNRIFCVDDFSYHAFVAMRELGVRLDG